jgi:hypothetical protein
VKEYGYAICIWNVKSSYKAGSLLTVSKELSKYKLPLMEVQKVRGESGGIEQQ